MNTYSFGRLAQRAVFGLAGVAAAVAVVGVGGVAAQAGTLKAPIAHLPIGSVIAQPLRYEAPTANLTKLANALQFKSKSVTTVVAAPAHLGLTHPTSITVNYGYTTSATRSYTDSFGARFTHDDNDWHGKPHYLQVFVTLAERVSPTETQQFEITWRPRLEPLYNVNISPLVFHLNNSCDWIGDSEPVVTWRDTRDVPGHASYSLDAGATRVINGFSRSYYGIGESAGLDLPAVNWWEDDPLNRDPGPPAAYHVNLVDYGSMVRSATYREGTGQDCTARLTYSVSSALLTYPAL